MSTAPVSPLMVSCPACQKSLRLPADAGGKKGKCPACQTIFRVPAPAARQAARYQPAGMPREQDAPRDAEPFDFGSPPAAASPAPSGMTFPDLDAQPPVKLKYPNPEAHDGFRLEKKGIDKGILGGIAMMVVAVVWFVVGLMCNFIFYYPPILFIVGIYAVIKGLATGNIAGGTTKKKKYY